MSTYNLGQVRKYAFYDLIELTHLVRKFHMKMCIVTIYVHKETYTHSERNMHKCKAASQKHTPSTLQTHTVPVMMEAKTNFPPSTKE